MRFQINNENLPDSPIPDRNTLVMKLKKIMTPEKKSFGIIINKQLFRSFEQISIVEFLPVSTGRGTQG